MVAMNEVLRVLFAGGGTGGHLYPAIAIAEEFERQLGKSRFKPLFVGTSRGIENRVLSRLGYELQKIWISGFHRGFSLSILLKNLLSPLKVLVSYLQSSRIIRRFQPHLVIGTGGYAQGLPLLVAARKGIPTALQEQNSYPGITSRLLDEKVDVIFLGFEESRPFFQNNNLRVYGVPVRGSLKVHPVEESRCFFHLKEDKKTVLIFGGSQGSRPINSFFYENISELRDRDLQFIWQTGHRDYNWIESRFGNRDGITVQAYIEKMDLAYSAADVCICRAGASTIAELAIMGLPAIFIPLPTAAADHQTKNAMVCVQKGAAFLIPQRELSLQTMADYLDQILGNPERQERMAKAMLSLAHPEAARHIVEDLLERIRE